MDVPTYQFIWATFMELVSIYLSFSLIQQPLMSTLYIDIIFNLLHVFNFMITVNPCDEGHALLGIYCTL